MSGHVNSEQPETKPATDSGYEADGLKSFICTSLLRVEYHRSFEYYQKWKIPMHSRRSSRLSKTSEKSPLRSPSPTEEVIQRKLRSNRQRKAKADVSIVNKNEGSDIIDIINSTRDAGRVAEEDEVKLVKVTDGGVDESDEDRYSVASSIASGPSVPHTTTEKLKPLPQDMCSACQKLYQHAKKMKTPIKNKLLDNDPKSLTCDQWVLIKKWRPKRLLNEKGKLLRHIQLVKKRLNDEKQTEQHAGEGKPSSCLRLHPFLQRNLRHKSVRVPAKKSRKRKRENFWSSDNAKKSRRHRNSKRQHTSIGPTDSNGPHPSNVHGGSPGSEGYTEQKSDSKSDADLIVEVIPTEVSFDKPRGAPPKHSAPKKTARFRDFLAQLRGKSSMIVKETH